MKKFFLIATLLLLCVLTTVFSVMGAPVADEDIYAAATQMTANNVLSGGTVEAHCPKCDKDVSWTPLSAITSVKEYKDGGHFYLDKDVSNKTYYHFYKNVCLHLNGHNITSSARAIYIETDCTMNIMGDGTVTGVGVANTTCDRGGALDIAGIANLYGGTYKHTTGYPVITSRGSKGGINMYNGTYITGTSGINGSNIRVHQSFLNVYGGVVENGIGDQGGNIYAGKKAVVNIQGGTITGGTVYMAENASSLTLTGAPKVHVINNFDGPKADISGLTQGADIQMVGQGAITKSDANIAEYAKYISSPNELVKLSVKDNAIFATVDVTADSTAPLTDGKTLKMLCLTSSFGLNTTELLYDIAVAEGFEEVIVARLYASGCSLQKHVNSYTADTGIYWYTKFTKDGKQELNDAKLLDGLLDEDWDIIYIQQGAEQTGQLKTYMDYLDQLLDIVDAHKTNADAKYIWNMTWAFQHDNDRKIFTDTFKGDQMLMHEAIVDAMQEKILTRSEFCVLLPTGAAVQNARSSYFGDTLTKDTLHLNNLGRVIAGYTVLATLLDKDLTEVNVGAVTSYDLTTPIRLSETDRQIVIECANAARANPFGVIQSKYTQEYLNSIGAKANEISFTGSTATTAYCPNCDKEVLWHPITNATSNKLTPTEGKFGHYFLAEDITYSSKYLYVDTVDAADGHAGYCIHLNDKNLTSTGKRAIWVGAGNTMNIMGSGTVCGAGEGSKESDWRGSALDLNGIVNLYGGTFTHSAARPAVILRTSAVRVHLFDGATIQGNQDYPVSLIRPTIKSAEVNVWGGVIEGGKAANGGNIYMAVKAVVNIYGGVIRNGYATSIGGNIYATNGTINMYGGEVYGGYTTNSSTSYGRGGNIALNGSSSTSPVFNMYGGIIGSETVTGEAAGYASSGGANLYVANGTANIIGEKAVISGGYGKSYGGNIMVSSNAYVNLMGGTVKNGKSDRGGNVYLAGTTSNFTQTGGVIENGTATASGGNTYVNNGNFTMSGGTSKGGSAPSGSNMHLKTGKSDAANFAMVAFDASAAAAAPVITGGNVLTERNVTFGEFVSTSDFTLSNTTVLTAAKGLVLEKAAFNNVLVNMNGNNATISGSGNITAYDTANEDYTTFGELTLTGVTLNNAPKQAVNGKDYYTIAEGNVYSFHLLDMKLASVALRPSVAGIYFSGLWQCDSKMAQHTDAYGVAVSLHNMPGSDFATDTEEDNMWSAYTQLESGATKSGVMITGILKEDRDPNLNEAYSKMPISAIAYITLDGVTYVSDGAQMSLADILTAAGDKVPADFLTYWNKYGLVI